MGEPSSVRKMLSVDLEAPGSIGDRKNGVRHKKRHDCGYGYPYVPLCALLRFRNAPVPVNVKNEVRFREKVCDHTRDHACHGGVRVTRKG